MKKSWLVPVMTGVYLVIGGCADGVKIVQQQGGGMVAIYPMKEGQGPMLSPFREEALDLMKEACPGGSYNIIREGETKGRTRVVSPLDGAQEMIEERRWGILFECK